MKKKITFSFVMLFVFFSAAFAQDLPKIAVYVTGDMPDNSKRVFGPELLTSLVNSGRYSGIERPNVFFTEAERKRTTEFGGAINDSQLSELGREFGVSYICVADILPAFGIFRIEVRIVDVETAQIIFTGESSGSLKTSGELKEVLEAIVGDMFQDLPRIAVYVTGDMPNSSKRSFGPMMLASLVNSGRYSGIERPDVFFTETERKRTTEFGGAINDSQLSELGREFGVSYVCVADILPAFGIFRIEVRIVDVETAQTIFTGESSGSLKTSGELKEVLEAIVGNMFVEQAASVAVASAPQVVAESKWPPKGAVCITGLNAALSSALSRSVISSLMKANVYKGVERIDQHITDTPTDGQIIQAGKREGVDFVFVINVSGQINVRILDVDLATELANISLDGKLNTPLDAGKVAASIVNFILKEGPQPPSAPFDAASQKMSKKTETENEQRAPRGADIYFAAKWMPLVLPAADIFVASFNLELGAVWGKGTSLGLVFGYGGNYYYDEVGMLGLNLGNVYELSPQWKLAYGSFFGFCLMNGYFCPLGPYVGLRLNNHFEFTNRFLIGSGVGYMATFGFHFGGSKRFRREAKPQNRNSNFYQDFHD